MALSLLLAITALAAPPTLTVLATDAVVGQAIEATADLSESPSASGELTFEVFGPDDPTCAGPALASSQAPVSGEGQYSSASFTPTAAGLYRWSAHYPGNEETPPAEAPCAAVSTVGKASPVLTASASAGAVGSAISDTATVTGGFLPSGEVSFSVFAPGDTNCSTPLATSSATLDSGAATSADFLPSQAGEFLWTASYLGDPNNEAVALPCGAANQTSAVNKASPSLSGAATSSIVGLAITDVVNLSGGFSPGGELVFRAYGPGDATCSTPPAYEATVPVSGNGPYSPPGFAPGPGVYLWAVGYTGDANNEAAALACGAGEQASAVGTIDVSLTAAVGGGTVGQPVEATATITGGAIPAGQITFSAFPPGNANCSGSPIFSAVVGVSGNGSYRSGGFVPSRVGTFRWTAAYSGDPNHAPGTVGCGQATSAIVPARPSIAGAVPQRVSVGTAFKDTATLQGGYAPGGTVTFRIYGPVSGGCEGPAFVNTVAVNGNGTVSSDPFVALRTGRYSFTASYSGDAENQAASEPCDSASQVVQVVKRAPLLKPRARLVGNRQIAIRARLSGGVSPTGAITFRLYGPGDKRCGRKPAFSGGIAVKANGTFSLARYIATKPGVYRLSVGYSGDQRNQRLKPRCAAAQPIRVA